MQIRQYNIVTINRKLILQYIVHQCISEAYNNADINIISLTINIAKPYLAVKD